MKYIDGKERRKPYRGSKAVDRSCRNHGSCSWCSKSRTVKHRRAELSATWTQEEIDQAEMVGCSADGSSKLYRWFIDGEEIRAFFDEEMDLFDEEFDEEIDLSDEDLVSDQERADVQRYVASLIEVSEDEYTDVEVGNMLIEESDTKKILMHVATKLGKDSRGQRYPLDLDEIRPPHKYQIGGAIVSSVAQPDSFEIALKDLQRGGYIRSFAAGSQVELLEKAWQLFDEDFMSRMCRHDKTFSDMVYDTHPGRRGWTCKRCGEAGVCLVF